MKQRLVICQLPTLVTLIQLLLHKGDTANVCYQCASTSAHSECSSEPTNAIHKNCSLGLTGFRNYYCVTQTIEQNGKMVAIIRECTTDAGLGVTWCQLDETPMTGFAIKCTFICSQDLCNSLPLHLNKPKADDIHNKGDKPSSDLSTKSVAVLLLAIALKEFSMN